MLTTLPIFWRPLRIGDGAAGYVENKQFIGMVKRSEVTKNEYCIVCPYHRVTTTYKTVRAGQNALLEELTKFLKCVTGQEIMPFEKQD